MRRLAVIVVIASSLLAGASTARAEMDVIVNKSTQQMSVVIDGSVRYIWNVSTGRDAYSTPNGTFVPERLERIWFSRRYYNSPMPYAIFFHNGDAIHGSYAIDRLGGPASHGCVRLHPEHAAILYDLVQREGPDNTRIVITGAPGSNFGPVPPPGAAPPPNAAPRQYHNLNDLIESLQEQCARTGPGTGNRPNPACVPYRATGEVADSHPNPHPAPTSPPTPAADPSGDPAQPHAGYRLLPKSYWSGAAWRWRLGLE
jgi:L,D-transpeptidase catalytic domain